MTNGIFGRYGPPSSARFDPESCSLKTSQVSLAGMEAAGSAAACVTWPRSGMWSSGRLSEPTTSVLPTAGSGSGSSHTWPTPGATNIEESPEDWDARNIRKRAENPNLGELQRKLSTEVQRTWTTPQASDLGRNTRYKQGGTALSVQARWPTPTSGDANSSGAAGYSTASGRHSGTTLTDATSGSRGPTAGPSIRRMWPTPYGLSGNQGQGDGEFGKAIRRMWPTATARLGDNRGSQAKRYENPASSNDLDDCVAARAAERIKGQLHPCWVEWLMGYPIGHTVCAASETPSSRRSSTGLDNECEQQE